MSLRKDQILKMCIPVVLPGNSVVVLPGNGGVVLKGPVTVVLAVVV